MNNVSVLPWYKRLDDQNARRWWVPGIYALYSRPDSIIPSFIKREKQDGYNVASRVYSGNSMPKTAIDESGYIYSDNNSTCWRFFGANLTNGKRLLIRNPGESGSGIIWTIYNEQDGEPIVFGSSPVIELPVDIDGENVSLYVVWNFAASQCWMLSESESILLPFISELYTADGDFVADIWSSGLWTATRVGDIDYLFPSGGLSENLPIGQYYIKASDGSDTWYSDVFTVVETALLPTFLKIDWWNADAIELVDGSIVPSIEQLGAAYTLYLKAEIAKPEYTYDEEGETRDGHFYPTKQLSQKVYKFAFLAPEFLLDAVRLLPLADHITITTNQGTDAEVVYTPEQILLTPSWESEGDIASVSVEFRTDTVVKKLGLAYIR